MPLSEIGSLAAAPKGRFQLQDKGDRPMKQGEKKQLVLIGIRKGGQKGFTLHGLPQIKAPRLKATA